MKQIYMLAEYTPPLLVTYPLPEVTFYNKMIKFNAWGIF